MQIHVLLFSIVLVNVPGKLSKNFELSIVHLNDFHARFEPTSTNESICKNDKCIGGYSRVFNKIETLRRKTPLPIILDAGDCFQGTAWHNLLTAWNVTQLFWNLLRFDAVTIGNHEFDQGIRNLARYMLALNMPIVVSNMVADNEPLLKALYSKSTTVIRSGKKIGIVGVIISSVTEIVASTGKLKFYNEIDSVNREASRLISEGCFTVIVLSHAGYDVDKEIAKHAAKGISVIVGGHTHTLLYNGTAPFLKASGSYPTVITRYATKILIVQASCCSYYLGNILIVYGNDGKVLSWKGNPIFLGNAMKQSKFANNILKKWTQKVEKSQRKIIGRVNVDMQHLVCRIRECMLGNFITEAMAEYWQRRGKTHKYKPCRPIAFMSAFGIRSDINKGRIKYIDLINAQPFSNNIDLGLIQGKYIIKALEFGFRTRDPIYGFNILQQTSLRIIVNRSENANKKIVNVEVCCYYRNLDSCKKLEPKKFYYVTIPSFLADGKDGFTMFSNNVVNRTTGPLDIYILVRHLKLKHIMPSIKDPIIDGRITFVD